MFWPTGDGGRGTADGGRLHSKLAIRTSYVIHGNRFCSKGAVGTPPMRVHGVRATQGTMRHGDARAAKCPRPYIGQLLDTKLDATAKSLICLALPTGLRQLSQIKHLPKSGTPNHPMGSLCLLPRVSH